MDRRAISLLALAHITDDVNQSFLPALLPLLVAERHLTYAAAATLVLGQAMSSSVVQPAIGYLADKRPMPWLVGLGLILAGGGIAGIGFMPSYALIFACALISGLGVAMFHPEAARFANLAAGSRKASGMRWFAVGGNIGFATGPLFATVALAAYGITGTIVAALPVAVMAVLLLRETRRFHTLLPKQISAKAKAAAPDDWSGFLRLGAYITVRSMAYIGLVSFIPLYFVHVVGVSPWLANLVLTAYLIAGIGGTIVGGALADRHGRREVIFASMGLSFVMVLAFATFTNGASLAAIVAGFILAPLLGVVMNGAQAASIVLAQEYLPNRLGMASGLTLGLAVSIGGMFTPVLGTIGDHWGLHASLLAIGALTALSLALALTMPNPAQRRALLVSRRAAA
jgi:FSR family fosmidomycin resistance protein-like MFS transporter